MSGDDEKVVDTPRPVVTPNESPFFARGSNAWLDVLPRTAHVDLFREADFSATSLGPISEWGPALRFYATMVFADSRAAVVFWGTERVALYNEEYAPLLAEAHPIMLGKSMKVALPTAFEASDALMSQAALTRRTIDIKNLSFNLVRQGLLEETYFVGQMIPIRGDSGEIEGVYNTVYESTSQVLYERQRRVVERIASTPTCPVEATLAHIMEALRSNPLDTPLAFLYSYDELMVPNKDNLRLCGTVGVPPNHPGIPTQARLEGDDDSIAPYFRQALKSGAPSVLSLTDDDNTMITALFDGVAWCGHGEPSRRVIILALKSGGRTLGFYGQGTNPRRPYDDKLEMSIIDTARQIEAKWASSISIEEARSREEALERQLTDSERRLRFMAQSAPLGMCQITSEGQIPWANDQFYDITGFPRHQTDLPGFIAVLAPEDREKAMDDFKVLGEGASRVSSELRLIRRFSPPSHELHDGEDATDIAAWVLTTAYPMNENGKFKMVLGYVTDISRQKWAESVQSRNASAATLARRRQEEFIDTTSHEMRNPLSAITQLADGIARSLYVPPEVYPSAEAYKSIVQENVDSANIILACAAHQKRVVDDVLILSRLESEMLSITPVQAQPANVVDNAVQMFSGEVAMNGISIQARRDASYDNFDVDHVLCDTSRLTQILINLISNAIKFTGSRAVREITITYGAQSARPPQVYTKFGHLQWVSPRDLNRVHTTLPNLKEGEDKLYLYFCVSDTGIGLTSMETERLFKRFSQATSRTHISYGGSGLGLYICKELAEKQGGQIGVASRRDEGASFAFYIETRSLESPTSKLEPTSTPSVPTVLAARSRRAPGRQDVVEVTDVTNGDVRGQSLQSHSTSPIAATSPPRGRRSPSQGRKVQVQHRPALPAGFHIILVEDNLVNQKVLAKQLRKANCTVTIANHGAEALEVLKRTECWQEPEIPNQDQADDARLKVDIILMDWEMPVMDGLTCTARIRELEREGRLVRRLPVIATTANVREEQQEQALAAGMDNVMSKPFSVGELLERIRTTVEAGVVPLVRT